MSVIFKFLFDFFTNPLGLPIDWFWEYVILAVIGTISFAVGWAASDGGEFGSLEHWSVRLLVFVVLWAIVYGVIWIVKQIIAYWILVLCLLGGLALIGSIIFIAVKKHRKGKFEDEKQRD